MVMKPQKTLGLLSLSSLFAMSLLLESCAPRARRACRQMKRPLRIGEDGIRLKEMMDLHRRLIPIGEGRMLDRPMARIQLIQKIQMMVVVKTPAQPVS